MGMMIALAGYAAVASRLVPMVKLGRLHLRTGMFRFVPTMFVHHVDLIGFYNPAGFGPEAFASSFPLAIWMITVGILMIRKGKAVAPSTIAPDVVLPDESVGKFGRSTSF